MVIFLHPPGACSIGKQRVWVYAVCVGGRRAVNLCVTLNGDGRRVGRKVEGGWTTLSFMVSYATGHLCTETSWLGNLKTDLRMIPCNIMIRLLIVLLFRLMKHKNDKPKCSLCMTTSRIVRNSSAHPTAAPNTCAGVPLRAALLLQSAK